MRKIYQNDSQKVAQEILCLVQNQKLHYFIQNGHVLRHFDTYLHPHIISLQEMV